jgi:hypothetical protein
VRTEDSCAAESYDFVNGQQRRKVAVAADLNNFFAFEQILNSAHISFAVAEVDNGIGIFMEQESFFNAA